MKNIFIKIFNINLVQKTLLSYKSNLPRIVYYHIVSNKSKIPYYYKDNLFNEKLLNDQLRWYVRNGFKFITLDEAIYLVQNNKNATKTIAFTTDDGFNENYFNIAPIFQKYEIKPTLFLISNCVDNKDLNWDCKVFLVKNSISTKKEVDICNRLSKKYNLRSDIENIVNFREHWPMALKEEIVNEAWNLANLEPLSYYLDKIKPYMTISQIKELVSDGYTIGSHSESHPDFSKLTEEETINEMIESKESLKIKLGIEPMYFAYPYGRRPSKIIEEKVIESNIYKMLFGTKSSLTNSKQNLIWERDKMEQDKDMSQFWFSAVPVLRNLVLHPLGKYK